MSPRQIPEEGFAVALPTIGGAVQGGTENSYAPISGVVALLGAFSISVLIPTGVPILSIAGNNGVKFPVPGLA